MKGSIYQIKSDKHEKIYIGSTIQPLKERLRCHVKDYNNYLKGQYRYVTSYEIIATGDYEIESLEEVECDTKKDLHEVERKWIQQNSCVNKFIPNRTCKEYYQNTREQRLEQQKEYRQDNKEKISQRHKEYYQKNKEKIKERDKEYYQDNKERRKEYLQNNKERISEQQKEYRQEHKEKISDQRAEYYQKKREQISDQRKEQIECECGAIVRKADIARHRKSKFHQEFIASS